MAAVEAVIFDLDGLLLESEQVWEAAKRRLVRERGGRWTDEASQAMLGMSSPEWAAYMRDRLEVPLEAAAIAAEVVRIMSELYADGLPVLPGAADCVPRLAARWPLGLASSSNRPLIDLVLELAGLSDAFAATVSSEEVARGKPSPDVYLEASARLGVDPAACVAVEDSEAGIRSAKAARMRVIALPNPDYPPGDEALALADAVIRSPAELTPALVEARSG